MMRRLFESPINPKFERILANLIPHDSYTVREGIVYPKHIMNFVKDGISTKFDVRVDKYSYKKNEMVFDFRPEDDDNISHKNNCDYYAYYLIKDYNDYDLYVIPADRVKEKYDEKKYIHTRCINGDSTHIVFNKDIFKDYLQTSKTLQMIYKEIITSHL